jgi:hypothetical protein
MANWELSDIQAMLDENKKLRKQNQELQNLVNTLVAGTWDEDRIMAVEEKAETVLGILKTWSPNYEKMMTQEESHERRIQKLERKFLVHMQRCHCALYAEMEKEE